jgi:hypothetical protein
VLRKVLGVVTAAAVGLLLVGVAWAAGDQAGDITSAGSQGTAADSSVASTDSNVASTAATSTVATSGTASTGTSVDATTPTSSAGSVTSTSVDDSSTTSVSLVDTSTTSTTVGSTTSTSLDDTTNSTVDDSDREETRGPAPVNTAPTSYQVGSSGTVTIQISAGRLILIDAAAASGWTGVVDRADGEEVRVEFDNGDDTAKFEARVHNGELRVRVEPS